MYSLVPGLALLSVSLPVGTSGPCTVLPRAMMGWVLAARPGPQEGATEMEQSG